MKHKIKIFSLAGVSISVLFLLLAGRSLLTPERLSSQGTLGSDQFQLNEAQQRLSLELAELKRQVQDLAYVKVEDGDTQGLRNLQAQIEQLRVAVTQNTNTDERDESVEVNAAQPVADDNQAGVQLTEEHYYETIEQSLIYEDVDPRWSLAAESVVTTAFEHDSLQSAAITHMECKTTLCKLEVSYDDSQDLNEITQNLRENIVSELPSGRVKVLADGSAVFYLARQKESFPEYTEETEVP